MESYVDTKNISIRLINKNLAKELIIKNHYSHKWSLCTYAFGVFQKKTNDKFFLGEVDELIGCAVYGGPVGRSASLSICEGIKSDEVIELTRLWIRDNVGKNIESYVISQSIKWLNKNASKIKIILSYSDDEQGHIGKIYQATNFYYIGRNSDTNLMPNYSISLSGPDEGYNWIHSRTVSERYGSHNVEHLKRIIGKTFYRKKEASKLKYIYFLGNKKQKKFLMKNLKQTILPYPKENIYEEDIEIIKVTTKSNTHNFFEFS